MSGHPAPEEMLLDYAAGALPQGPALAVALHVALDPVARRTVERLGALGGALMEGEDPAAVDEAVLQRTLAGLDGIAVEPRQAPYVPRPGFSWAPAPLARHLGSGAQWRRETVSIRPDLFNPLQYAVAQHGIPTPPGSGGSNYWLGFQVEQWAPFAAPSSMFNKDQSVNSGFAVDVWRPNPFSTASGFSNATLDKLFSGIQVDVAVRDTDAWLHRVSYEIVLLGRIVFGPIIIL